jgi:hypothetical protein
MGEFEEFAEALFGQLSVEINEEKDIIKLDEKAKEDLQSEVKFNDLEKITKEVFPSLKQKVEEFLGIKILDVKVKFLELKELKKFKG